MLLHDEGLRAAMASDAIQITPYDAKRLQPSSIDLTLDHQFRVPSFTPLVIDPKEDNSDNMSLISLEEDEYLDLAPGSFILASTAEIVYLNLSHAARVEGKSSLGRLGLLVHATAGFIDPGFYGQVTLELFNLAPAPLRLYPGMPIAQLAVFQMAGECTTGYDVTGKYSGQTGPTASKYHLNFL